MQEQQEIRTAIDALAAEWDVSAAVNVFADNTMLHGAVYGYADREAGVPLSEDARWCFSMQSPLLMGLGALLLVEEGKLGLDDPLARYLPEYPQAGCVQVRQLFRRESGIPECISTHLIPALNTEGLPEAERIVRERACRNAALPFSRVLELIGAAPLEYAPGSDCDYSDAEPLFARAVVERAAGTPLFDLLAERVFDPLGMKDTVAGAHTDCTCAVRDPQERLVRMPAPPDTDAITTTQADLCRLLEALQRRSLFSAHTWREAVRFNKYGEGVGFSSLNGLVCGELEHLYGFHAVLVFAKKPDGLRYLVTVNEEPRAENRNGRWHSFRPALRRELEGRFARPVAPKLVRYGESNAFDAMALELAPGQERFVADAKSCLCWAYANGGAYRSYVLMDEGRAVGLLVLRIDRKQGRFDIADVLIDRRYQGRGYGKAMLEQGKAILKRNGAKELTLYCVRDNVAACRLYQSVGFEPVALYDQVQQMRCTL